MATELPPKPKRLRIVAEISLNWPLVGDDEPRLGQRFEEVIETNRLRGYELESWRLCQSTPGGALIETIVAVFVLTRFQIAREGRKLKALAAGPIEEQK